MGNPKVDAALTVQWPAANNAADPTHEHGVIFRVANATSSTVIGSTSVPIPKNVRGRYWRMLTDGASCEWGWLLENGGMFPGSAADTAPTLVYGQLSTMGTGHLAAQPRLKDGFPEHQFCPKDAYALVYISSAATGIFEASVSGKKVTHNP